MASWIIGTFFFLNANKNRLRLAGNRGAGSGQRIYQKPETSPYMKLITEPSLTAPSTLKRNMRKVTRKEKNCRWKCWSQNKSFIVDKIIELLDDSVKGLEKCTIVTEQVVMNFYYAKKKI